MNIAVNPLFSVLPRAPLSPGTGSIHSRSPFKAGKDSVRFGAQSPSAAEASSIIVERALERLRQVVSDARAELGIPEGATFDTSPEATAQRIVDFALGFFNQYLGNHQELSEDDARQEFATFIGTAIQQGIQEAQDILGALNALNPEVESLIGAIESILQEQLDAFAANATGAVAANGPT